MFGVFNLNALGIIRGLLCWVRLPYLGGGEIDLVMRRCVHTITLGIENMWRWVECGLIIFLESTRKGIVYGPSIEIVVVNCCIVGHSIGIL